MYNIATPQQNKQANPFENSSIKLLPLASEYHNLCTIQLREFKEWAVRGMFHFTAREFTRRQNKRVRKGGSSHWTNRLNTCCLRTASLVLKYSETSFTVLYKVVSETHPSKAWLIFASNCDTACFMSEWLQSQTDVCYFWVGHPSKIQGRIFLSETHL